MRTYKKAGCKNGMIPMKEQTLGELLRKLRTVSDTAWGHYAFSRDILRDRTPPKQRNEMIQGAISCGIKWAEKMQKQTETANPADMANTLGLHVTECFQSMTERRVLFAQFVPEQRIEIMRQPLDTYAALYQKEAYGKEASHFPTPEQVRDLLLAHEIFHYVEDRHADEIYTRTETIRLWKIFCFKNDSIIRAVGEIAAMCFAKTLLTLDYNPFLLDFLLYYGYNKAESEMIFHSIIAIMQKMQNESIPKI